MKSSLFFCLFMMGFFVFGQKNEIIKIYKLKDKTGKVKSFTVIDNRVDKDLGSISFRKDTYNYNFENPDLKSYIENSFLEDNKKNNGTNDIVFIISELKILNDPKNLYGVTAKLNTATFIKRNTNYYFIDRVEGGISGSVVGGSAGLPIGESVGKIISQLIVDSYSNIAISVPIKEENLNNYESIITKTYSVYNNASLIDGVYLDYKSFVQQKPTPAKYRKDKDGDIKGVNDGVYDIPITSIYCIVENNKILKAIPIGYREVFNDDKGMYFEAAPKDLFVQSNNGAMIGAMTGGMLGALIGGALDKGGSTSGNHSKGITKIYIDKLTGNYIFRD